MSEKNILFAGLPSSGKTTFIAAFWHFLTDSTSENLISLNSLAGDNGYLNGICRQWLNFNPVTRTNPNGEEIVAMNIKNNQNGQNAILKIPDYSGEVFRNIFDLREWSTLFDTLIDETDGIVLFVNPTEKMNRPQFITIENEILGLFGEELYAKNTGDKKSWNVAFVPHQVKLVDILQFIEYKKPKKLPLKITIVISAWDLVINNNHTKNYSPVRFLSTYLPLLFQFLVCNEDKYKVEYFGVSAQGGNYDGIEANELMRKKPEQRILVREEDSITNNIAKPIFWAME